MDTRTALYVPSEFDANENWNLLKVHSNESGDFTIATDAFSGVAVHFRQPVSGRGDFPEVYAALQHLQAAMVEEKNLSKAHVPPVAPQNAHFFDELQRNNAFRQYEDTDRETQHNVTRNFTYSGALLCPGDRTLSATGKCYLSVIPIENGFEIETRQYHSEPGEDNAIIITEKDAPKTCDAVARLYNAMYHERKKSLEIFGEILGSKPRSVFSAAEYENIRSGIQYMRATLPQIGVA